MLDCIINHIQDDTTTVKYQKSDFVRVFILNEHVGIESDDFEVGGNIHQHAYHMRYTLQHN